MSDNWYWYHLIATTYGAWLYGDSRGFRTRHHREHVEGDYKNPPPPGTYAALERRSRESMPQEPVVLPVVLRSVVGMCVLERAARARLAGDNDLGVRAARSRPGQDAVR